VLLSFSLFFRSKKKLCAIYGKWTECLYTVDHVTFDAHTKSDKKSSDEKKDSKRVLNVWSAFKITRVPPPLGAR